MFGNIMAVSFSPELALLKEPFDDADVKANNMMTSRGPRVVVEITPKGMEAYGTLLNTLGKLGK
jgi:hypothetical protein